MKGTEGLREEANCGSMATYTIVPNASVVVTTSHDQINDSTEQAAQTNLRTFSVPMNEHLVADTVVSSLLQASGTRSKTTGRTLSSENGRE